jgi:hypothetical protein
MQKKKVSQIHGQNLADGQDVGLTDKKYCPRARRLFHGRSLSADNADVSVVRKSYKTPNLTGQIFILRYMLLCFLLLLKTTMGKIFQMVQAFKKFRFFAFI